MFVFVTSWCLILIFLTKSGHHLVFDDITGRFSQSRSNQSDRKQLGVAPLNLQQQTLKKHHRSSG